MGYFANGTEGELYEAQWCERCVHYGDSFGCEVLNLHMQFNYDECNKADSMLHKLIPRDGITNEKCRMFFEAKS